MLATFFWRDRDPGCSWLPAKISRLITRILTVIITIMAIILGNNGYEKAIEGIPLEASTSRELHLDFPGIDPRHGRFSESLRVSCVFSYYARREQSAIPARACQGHGG